MTEEAANSPEAPVARALEAVNPEVIVPLNVGDASVLLLKLCASSVLTTVLEEPL